MFHNPVPDPWSAPNSSPTVPEATMSNLGEKFEQFKLDNTIPSTISDNEIWPLFVQHINH